MRQFDIRKFQFQLIKEAPNGRQSLAHNVLGVVYAVGYAVFDPAENARYQVSNPVQRYADYVLKRIKYRRYYRSDGIDHCGNYGFNRIPGSGDDLFPDGHISDDHNTDCSEHLGDYIPNSVDNWCQDSLNAIPHSGPDSLDRITDSRDDGADHLQGV